MYVNIKPNYLIESFKNDPVTPIRILRPTYLAIIYESHVTDLTDFDRKSLLLSKFKYFSNVYKISIIN